MITWTHVRTVDGNEVGKTRSTLTLGRVEWTAAWLAATGSFGSFLVKSCEPCACLGRVALAAANARLRPVTRQRSCGSALYE